MMIPLEASSVIGSISGITELVKDMGKQTSWLNFLKQCSFGTGFY
jgi:hypothetical protein